MDTQTQVVDKHLPPVSDRVKRPASDILVGTDKKRKTSEFQIIGLEPKQVDWKVQTMSGVKQIDVVNAYLRSQLTPGLENGFDNDTFQKRSAELKQYEFEHFVVVILDCNQKKYDKKVEGSTCSFYANRIVLRSGVKRFDSDEILDPYYNFSAPARISSTSSGIPTGLVTKLNLFLQTELFRLCWAKIRQQWENNLALDADSMVVKSIVAVQYPEGSIKPKKKSRYPFANSPNLWRKKAAKKVAVAPSQK